MYLRLFLFLAVSIATAILSGYLKQTLLRNPVEREQVIPFWLNSEQANDSEKKLNTLAHLGSLIFFDKKFSNSSDKSCSSCHKLEYGFGDNVDSSELLKKKSVLNTPPLSTLAAQKFYFHDGRSSNLVDAIVEHMEDPVILGLSRLSITRYVSQNHVSQWGQVYGSMPVALSEWLEQSEEDGAEIVDAQPEWKDPSVPKDMADLWDLYRLQERDVPLAWSEHFEQLPPKVRTLTGEISQKVAKALAAFIESYSLAPSSFDRFVEKSASGGLGAQFVPGFGESELSGFKLFTGAAGCANCHNGPYFTDGEFYNTGLARGERLILGRAEGLLWCGEAAECNPTSLSLNGKDILRELGKIRTPSLRQLRYTAPYLHDGSFDDLKSLIGAYSEGVHLGLGQQDPRIRDIHLSDDEIEDLANFLMSLSVPLDRY